jgi:hypothetical protein
MRTIRIGGVAMMSAWSLFLAAALGSCSKDNETNGSGAGTGGQAGKAGSGTGSDAGTPASPSHAGDGGAGPSAGAAGSAGNLGGRGGSAGQSPGGGGGGDAGAAVAAGQANAGSGGAPMSCSDDFDCDGFTCCDGKCANRANDPFNCGMCGVECAAGTPYCGGTSCIARPCTTTCESGETCCGSACCGAGELCCLRTIGAAVAECQLPVNGTCPRGCGDCS